MTHFLKDGTGLGNAKTDYTTFPSIPADQKVVAVDWNTVRQALLDVQSWWRGGAEWQGLQAQASNPNPAGLTNYLWLDNSGNLNLTLSGVTTALGKVPTIRTINTSFGLTGGGDLSANRTLKFDSQAIGFVSVKDPTYGAAGDGVTDDRAAIQSAINAAASLNCDVFFPPGTYVVSRTSGTSYSLILQSRTSMGLRGIKGQSWIKHINSAGTGVGSCQMLRISDCEKITIKGVNFDGNWGNSLTYVTPSSDLVDLGVATTLNVDDTSEFPAGPNSATLVTDAGAQVFTYTGKTATTFTGCTFPDGGRVQKYDWVGLIDKRQKTTTTASGSNGLSLPQATINVASTTGFPTNTSSGFVQILTDAGWQDIAYTGKTGTSFTGCTGGAGVMATGNGVQYVNGGGNQATPMQVDPKNHGIFIYGSDGNLETPNRDILIEDCLFKDIYGDNIWIGAWSYGIKIVRSHGMITARNGITMSSWTDDVSMIGCTWRSCFTSAVDSEPVDSYVTNVKIDDCEMGVWFNRYASNANIVMSIQGGTVGRPAEWNYCKHWRVTRSRFEGTCLISDAKDIVIDECQFNIDYATTEWGPIVVEMFCDNVWITKTYAWSRASGSTLSSRALVNVVRYQTGVNTAAQPGNIYVQNNALHARNNLRAVYVEATGGYSGYSGTATGYTPPSGPNNNGTITVASTPWASQINYWAGHQILMGNKIANIVGNTSNTLSIAPVYEQYSAGKAWHDAQGQIVIDPAAGAFTILPLGGIVHVDDNTIDCRNIDGAGAGAEGIWVNTDSTWDPGFNHMRVSANRNNIRGATGAGLRITTHPAAAVSWKELHCVGNHVWDDQTTPTCTAAVLWENADKIDLKVIHGNTKDSNVVVMHSGLTSGSWRCNGDYPEEWAGYQDPNGLITAPPTSTYKRINSNAIFLKESPGDTNTGWAALKGATRVGIRSIGIQQSGTGSLDMSGKMPASVDGDIEILFINTSVGSAAGSDATLSTAARFVKKSSATSNYNSNQLVNRAAMWWRRKQPGDTAPVVADSGDFNEAVVIAFKDCIGYGDPYDFSPVATTNTTLTMSVTATGGTTVSDGALFAVFLAFFNGGSSNNVSAWANADSDLTEEYEAADLPATIGGDWVGMGLFAGRVEIAAAIGNTTATIGGPSYALWTSLAFALKPATVAARSTGLITCTTKANYVDTDFMTIPDGIGIAKVYEFDTAGDGVTAGRVQVNISADTTAAQVAARLRTAILTNQPSLSVTDNADGTLSIVHQWAGAGGNVSMTENVANAGHTVSGLSGGQG